MFDLVSPVNKAYAEKNDFEYITSDIKRCPDRNIWWEKIAWLKELLSTLEDGAMVVYMDCDSISLAGDPKTALVGEYGMVSLRTGLNRSQIAGWYNAGVIMMLNTPDVRAFFQRVWDRNDATDETSMNLEIKALHGTIGNGKAVYGLGVEWNSWDNNNHLVPGECIKSWHGVRYEEKLKLIKEFLNK